MKNTLADVWQSFGGVSITDLGTNIFLFYFFYEVDIQRVMTDNL